MSVSTENPPKTVKSLSKKRNNSGTFNIDNPKKMKKTSKALKEKKQPAESDANNVVKDANKSKDKKGMVTDGIDGMEFKKAPKRKSSADNSDTTPNKKSKAPFKNQHGFKKGFNSNKHPSQGFNKNPSGANSEKPDWNKFKAEKKTLRDKRRAAERDADSYEISIEAKKILESIRSRKCPATEQIKQLENLHSLLKGKLLSVAYAHDMSRVVETMLKLAHAHKKNDIYKEIVEELMPEVLEMSKRKYATHVVRAIIAHSQPSVRNQIVKSFHGHVMKLLVHKIGGVVLAQLHSKCKQEEQQELQRELYGGSQRLISSEPVTGLDVIFKHLPKMKESTLSNTKENLLGLFEKNIVESHIVHAVLLDYLSCANPNDIAELLEEARKHMKALTLSKEGINVAMMCVWMGSTKARKKILKDVKEGVLSLACGEHSHMLLLAIFDSIDDTVLVQKVILSELLSGDLSPLLNNTYGRKVLMYLCSRRDPRMFTAPVIAILATGDGNPHSKKETDTRATELRNYTVPLLLQDIAKNTSQWMNHNSNLLILQTAITAGSGNELNGVFKAIVKFVTNPPKTDSKSDLKKEIIDLSIADNAGVHMILKKLAQHDKVLAENGSDTFGAELISALTDQHYLVWLKNNRCCFLLLEVLKNGPDEVVQQLKSKIQNISPSIWKKKKEIPIGGQMRLSNS